MMSDFHAPAGRHELDTNGPGADSAPTTAKRALFTPDPAGFAAGAQPQATLELAALHGSAAHHAAQATASAAESPEGKLASLLRLFQSDFFNMTMALMYLHRYSDNDVQEYLCSAMRRFPREDLEFFLPQLLSIFMQQPYAYQHLRSLLLEQAASSVHFSLLLTWLLKAEIDTLHDPDRLNAAVALHRSILSTERHDPPTEIPDDPPLSPPFLPQPEGMQRLHQLNKKGHRRSKSDITASPLTTRITLDHTRLHKAATRSVSASPQRPKPFAKRCDSSSSLKELTTGRAFFDREHNDLDGQAITRSSASLAEDLSHSLTEALMSADPQQQHTLEQLMSPEINFVKALVDIGLRLARFPPDVRRTQLYAELALLNLNLPARVFLPLRIGAIGGALGARTARETANARKRPGVVVADHHVVRIPPQEAVTLNSKEKVPYMVQVEVVDCKDYETSPLPAKLALKQRSHRRSVSETNARRARAFPVVAAADSEEAEREGLFRPGEIRRRLSQASQAGRAQFQDHHDDPSAKAFKEPWGEKIERIRMNSPYGHLPNWRLVPVIVKSGDDLRQELLASQLLHLFQEAWQEEQIPLKLRPLRILVTSSDSGLVEVVGSAVSLHQTKKHQPAGFTLLQYFKQEFGGIHSESFLQAQRNYVESLAAYSLFCYFVQVKDRHNGNILIDGEGHILHIDFGFMLSSSPGRNLGFENAPFKLTDEFVEVMGGVSSDMFTYFKMLLLKGFLAARKHMDRFTTTVEVMQKNSELPCFVGGESSVTAFRDRFQMGLTEDHLVAHVEELLGLSLENLSTRLYDGFQYLTNGIM